MEKLQKRVKPDICWQLGGFPLCREVEAPSETYGRLRRNDVGLRRSLDLPDSDLPTPNRPISGFPMPASNADFSQSLRPTCRSGQSFHSGKLLSALRTLQTIHLLSAIPSLSKGPTMLVTRSSRISALTIAVILFAVLSSLTAECQAQRRRWIPGQEVHRFLGLYHGAGYHCSNPGQNTDYYNPYSAHNSTLTAGYDPYNGYGQGYSSFDTGGVPHSSYTSRDQGQHSVFESLPGQTVQPRFEPAVDRTRKKKDEDDFNLDSDDGSDFDPDEDFDDESEFGSSSRSEFDTPSTLDELEDFVEDSADGGDGDFDALKSNFDDLKDSVDEASSFLN